MSGPPVRNLLLTLKMIDQSKTQDKIKLERSLKIVSGISPALFAMADRLFNIPRYIDLVNLRRIFGDSKVKVLEIGCGKGYFAPYFGKIGCEYHGIDIDLEEIRLLRKLKRSKRAIAGDAAALPYKDATYDTIFCNCVIEHIQNDEEVLREAARVLKPGGAMVFTFPTRALKPQGIKAFLRRHVRLRFLADRRNLEYFKYDNVHDAEKWYVEKRWHHVRHGYRIGELRERFANLGLEIEECFHYFTRPCVEIWDLCTFSVLNKIFPFSLILFSPLMMLCGADKRGDETNSLLVAVKAVKKKGVK